jgi:hypothetical protein
MEPKETTDYTATITPEFLNISSKEPEENMYELSCNVQSCHFFKYLIMIIIFYILFELLIKLKNIIFKVSSILEIISTIAFKVDSIYSHLHHLNKIEPKNDLNFNLNYILDFIQQIDKKNKRD